MNMYMVQTSVGLLLPYFGANEEEVEIKAVLDGHVVVNVKLVRKIR